MTNYTTEKKTQRGVIEVIMKDTRQCGRRKEKWVTRRLKERKEKKGDCNCNCNEGADDEEKSPMVYRAR